MARFAWKSSSTLSHRLSVINLAIQRFNSKKEQEETRRLRITHRVSLVSKTTRGGAANSILAISSLGFVGLALRGVGLFNQIPRLNQRLNHRSSSGSVEHFSVASATSAMRRGTEAITGRLDGDFEARNLVHTAHNLPSLPEHKNTHDEREIGWKMFFSLASSS